MHNSMQSNECSGKKILMQKCFPHVENITQNYINYPIVLITETPIFLCRGDS